MKSRPFLSRLLSLLLAFILFAAPAAALPESGAERLELLEEIMEYIEHYALYPPASLSLDGITARQLEGAAGLMMFDIIIDSWLLDDPYGSFMLRGEYNALFDAGPTVYGIGIEVDMSMPLGVYVRAFLPGGGAELSGMEAGAQIVSVDGVCIKDKPYIENRRLFLGEQGTLVEIGYINPGSAKIFYDTIKRGPLRVDNIKYEMIEDTDVGYISISRFGSYWTDYFLFCTYYHETLPSLGAKSVIIDLRGNPGGELATILYILNVITREQGLLLCRRVDSDGDFDFLSTGWEPDDPPIKGGIFWEPENIVILVNGRSASASEVMAGTLQALEMAIVVGETTYGKSHSQYHIELSSDDILIITADRIELYGIGTYEHSGITPDHEVGLEVITGEELFEHPLDTSRALFRNSVMTGRVSAMQERLALLGYYRTEPSGVFDDYTLWCLHRFQAAAGLHQGRFANAETLKALEKASGEINIYIDTQLPFALELLGYTS
jgi:carboxyl-terminal processing protease